jgi:hypothetical protein
MNAISMSVVTLLYVHILWHVEICQAFKLRILSVSLGMKVRNEVNSREDTGDSVQVLQIVLPILIVLVLLAISSAILFLFFRHFKQKDKAESTENNQKVVTVCVRTNKLSVSMQCWRHLFQTVISFVLLYVWPIIFLSTRNNLCAKLHLTVGTRSTV